MVFGINFWDVCHEIGRRLWVLLLEIICSGLLVHQLTLMKISGFSGGSGHGER